MTWAIALNYVRIVKLAHAYGYMCNLACVDVLLVAECAELGVLCSFDRVAATGPQKIADADRTFSMQPPVCKVRVLAASCHYQLLASVCLPRSSL